MVLVDVLRLGQVEFAAYSSSFGSPDADVGAAAEDTSSVASDNAGIRNGSARLLLNLKFLSISLLETPGLETCCLAAWNRGCCSDMDSTRQLGMVTEAIAFVF